MNGMLLAQFNLQSEDDTYKQDLDTFLLSFDLSLSPSVNRQKIGLQKNTPDLANTASVYTLGPVQTFLYIRATQGLKVSLTSPNISGFVNMDRIFFTASQFTSVTLNNLNTLFDAQVLLVYG